LTNSNGSAINNSSFNYSPYGEIINGDGSLTNYHFTGQYRDANLWLQYHRARWLNTANANWLSIDPISDFPGNFGNPYAYAGLNPVNRIDPTGTMSLTEICLVSALVLVLVTFTLISLFGQPKGYDEKIELFRQDKGRRIIFDIGSEERGWSIPPPDVKRRDVVISATTPDDFDAKLRGFKFESTDVIEIHGHGSIGMISFAAASATTNDESLYFFDLDYISDPPYLPGEIGKRQQYKPIPIPKGVIVHILVCDLANDYTLGGTFRTYTWKDDIGPAFSRYFGNNKIVAYDGKIWPDGRWFSKRDLWLEKNHNKVEYIPE